MAPTASATPTTAARATNEKQNVLIVDHLNLNHERGRHDLLSAFYFDLLGLAIDPRKVGGVGKQRLPIHNHRVG